MSEEFRPVRFQYQRILYALFNQYRRLPPQLAYHSPAANGQFPGASAIDAAADSNHGALVPRRRRSGDTISPGGDRKFVFSRYESDFIEIEKLASGGFGSVYKVNIKI